MAQRQLRNQLDDENLPRSPRRRLRTSRNYPNKIESGPGMPPSPMNYGMVMRAVEPQQVLLNTDPQQDTERYPPDLPDPEQAQRVTIRRQEAEGLLVDTPYMLEDTRGPGAVDEFVRAAITDGSFTIFMHSAFWEGPNGDAASCRVSGTTARDRWERWAIH
ncbi:uncharacterized protein ATNIH1004_011622 [Aspergillus tanneri]|uniref:Uncharacterized protein n=1 Tax=Aspergillus tanneri TaxID=1220188 RepID=A0A5M9MII7_9EURO|nr:uncharacterized protein ATNIH1004_011622 [Aspergillus tanneri]KAA8642677.1 hypothetical protein ATNIH1004_011622 [Aspergillus tanneri]